MGAIGIVAEYDPFHSGHKHHINAARAALGADLPVVCAMSGNWTQRGSAAIADKWTRARLALLGGADLVLELPTPWAAASAERFARGAVELLNMTGVVDTICFGSESGDLSELEGAVAALDGPDYPERRRAELGRGEPYAAARAAAAGCPCLDGPNNNLAVEYLRALRRLNSGMRPFTVPRLGDGHNAALSGGGHPSASALRALLRAGDGRVWDYLDPAARESLEGGLADLERAFPAILARLRTLSPAELARIPDCGEGLENRLLAAAGRARSLTELYDLAKSKRYAHARIRRVVLRAFLGVYELPEQVPYLRVLGMNGRGQALLREMRGLPVITKPAHGRGQPLLEAEARYTDLYALCFDPIRPAGLEWTPSPVIQKD